jgi:hypothetical protein
VELELKLFYFSFWEVDRKRNEPFVWTIVGQVTSFEGQNHLFQLVKMYPKAGLIYGIEFLVF